MTCDQFEKWRHFCFWYGFEWSYIFVWYINLVLETRRLWHQQHRIDIYQHFAQNMVIFDVKPYSHTCEALVRMKRKKKRLCKHMAALVLSVFYRHS